MNTEECITKSKEWLRELNHRQLFKAIIEVKDYELDKTVALFESLLNHLEDCSDMGESYNEKISSLEDEFYEKGYNQAIEDVVFVLNSQDVDSDVVTLIEGM